MGEVDELAVQLGSDRDVQGIADEADRRGRARSRRAAATSDLVAAGEELQTKSRAGYVAAPPTAWGVAEPGIPLADLVKGRVGDVRHRAEA